MKNIEPNTKKILIKKATFEKKIHILYKKKQSCIQSLCQIK